jgi:hypothetical protein
MSVRLQEARLTECHFLNSRKIHTMNANNTVIQFAARPPKQALKRWTGPIQAERERCLAVCLHPAARGHWGSVARTFLCETAAGADEIIERLEAIRAKVHTELKEELAAGFFNTGTAT